jgi:hypothetical protein
LVNMIQDVAERNGNINVDIVTDALKNATQRITGPKYLTSGLGDSGGCVIPDFRILVNNIQISIQDFYHRWKQNPKGNYVLGADHSCEYTESKEVLEVTSREFDGLLIKIITDNGEITVTPDHLIPICRDGDHIIVRADQILNTDELYCL